MLCHYVARKLRRNRGNVRFPTLADIPLSTQNRPRMWPQLALQTQLLACRRASLKNAVRLLS